MARVNRLGDHGSLSIPMLLGLLALSAFLFGNYFLVRDLRLQVERQLRLDRCTGEAALALKSRLMKIESSIPRFRALKLAVIAATALPETLPVAKAALRAEYLWQESTRLGWETARTGWLIRPACGETGGAFSIRFPYPAFPWIRDPEDAIGPGELRLSMASKTAETFEESSEKFRLEVQARARSSAAVVEKKKSGNIDSNWKARWAVPHG